MAGTGTVQKTRCTSYPGSSEREAIKQLNGLTQMLTYQVEDLSAGSDFTARIIWSPSVACYITAIKVLWYAATVGVDGSNTLVIDVANATQSVTIGTLSRTATNTANTASSLTLTEANQDVAASDVVTLAVTQGATANAGTFGIQIEYRSFEQIGDAAGTAITT